MPGSGSLLNDSFHDQNCASIQRQSQKRMRAIELKHGRRLIIPAEQVMRFVSIFLHIEFPASHGLPAFLTDL
jgi:hypothetical protein